MLPEPAETSIRVRVPRGYPSAVHGCRIERPMTVRPLDDLGGPIRGMTRRSSPADIPVMETVWAPRQQANLWMDVPDAAQYAGVARDDVQAAINTRQVPAITSHPRRPGVWMVRLSDLDAWLATWPRLAS